MATNNYRYLARTQQITKKTTSKTSSKPLSMRIISNTPGRLRLRVAPCDRQTNKMQHIINTLQAQPNINQVRTNIQHGSILINHDRKESSLENIIATFADIGILFVDITEGKSDAAVDIMNAVVDLNKRVEQTTQGSVDLRVLFPLGLSILAARQLLARGLELEVIPWYVLAWYAFDSFMKLNSTRQLKAEV